MLTQEDDVDAHTPRSTRDHDVEALYGDADRAEFVACNVLRLAGVLTGLEPT